MRLVLGLEAKNVGIILSDADLKTTVEAVKMSSSRKEEDKDNENLQIPRPIKNDIGFPNTQISQVQTNERGIKIYPQMAVGASPAAPYSGRLITFAETPLTLFFLNRGSIGE